jgi:hypothetical protein
LATTTFMGLPWRIERAIEARSMRVAVGLAPWA